jgi:hypothetical protein
MSGSRRGRLSPARHSYALFLVWLWAGYACALRLFAGVPWVAAVWQAAACVLAVVPFLLAVLNLLSEAKLLGWLPAPVLRALWRIADLAQFAIPWLGWAALIRLVNAGAVSWTAALRSGGAIGIFSYLSGLALLVRFRPQAADVEVTEVTVAIPGLPAAFDGYRILHISDIHCRSFLSAREVALRLLPAQSLHPDLIAFTGDLADGGETRADAAAEALSQIPAEDGIVAVPGNHDVWAGEARVRATLARHGIETLVNGHRALTRHGDTLYLVGVNDASYTRRADLAAALDRVPPESTVILLSHAPEIMRDPLAQRAALVLSGHTHGGQVVLPGIGPLYVPSRLGRRYAFGLHRFGSTWLFITRGLGEVTPPLRLNCPPEIALLTLKSAASN